MAEPPSSSSFTPPAIGTLRNGVDHQQAEQLKSLAMLTPEEQWAALLGPVATHPNVHNPAVFTTPGGFASLPPPPPPQQPEMYQQQQPFDARVKFETPYLGPTAEFGLPTLPPPPLANADASTKQQQRANSSGAAASSGGPAPKATRSCDSCSLRSVHPLSLP